MSMAVIVGQKAWRRGRRRRRAAKAPSTLHEVSLREQRAKVRSSVDGPSLRFGLVAWPLLTSCVEERRPRRPCTAAMLPRRATRSDR